MQAERDQAVSHRGNARGIVALLNRAADRAQHAILTLVALYGYSQLQQKPAAPSANYGHLSKTENGFLHIRGQGDLPPGYEAIAATVNELRHARGEETHL